MSEGTEGTVNDGAVNGNLLAHQDAGASCGCGCGDSAAVEGQESNGADAGSHGYTPDKKRYLARLKRIEGQVRGLHRMVDEDTYCIDVLTQVTAVQSALKSVALALLDDHMQHCVLHAAQQGEEEAMEKLDEVSAAVARLVR